MRREQPHPGAQLTFTDIDGHRFQVFITDLVDRDVAYLEALQRGRGRAEKLVCNLKATGLTNLPSADFAINTAWMTMTLTAHDLLAWTRLVALDGDLARAEPKRLPYFRLPELFDRLLNGATPVGALRIDDTLRASYLAELPLLARVCADLASTHTVDALDHADLHGTNVLVHGSRHRLVDWGDSCITHPFSTLFVPYEFVVASLPERERRPATLRLRDAYLETWGASSENREALGLAVWVARITRAVNIAHETLGDTDDHGEITSLLRSWHARRTLLGDCDEVLQSI